MNTKKIWMLAIMFGMVMSIIFLMLTSNNVKNNTSEIQPLVEAKDVEMKGIQEDDSKILEIEKGKRAISIPVDQIQSVSGLVEPGAFVDVVAISPVPIVETSTSQILLTNVKVLAVGQTLINEGIEETNKKQEPYQMVTLEVTPPEGASIAFANETGVLTLMLRGASD